MQQFANYLKNLNWLVAFDVLAILVFAILIFVFFKRRNNLKVAILYSTYMLVYLGVSIFCALSENNALYVTNFILRIVGLAFIVSFVVIYQKDIKNFISKLSGNYDRNKHHDGFGGSDEDLKVAASEIVKACQNMSKNDVGAIIIIAPTVVPSHILDTGTDLNALVTSGLLESIFNTKAPLHDGAVVVKGNCILSAGCFLPLTQETNISKELGTRHRAAIGISEESDVLSIVVSEETGIISTVTNGEIKRYMTPEKLYEEIINAFGINYEYENK